MGSRLSKVAKGKRKSPVPDDPSPKYQSTDMTDEARMGLVRAYVEHTELELVDSIIEHIIVELEKGVMAGKLDVEYELGPKFLKTLSKKFPYVKFSITYPSPTTVVTWKYTRDIPVDVSISQDTSSTRYEYERMAHGN